MSLTFTVHGLPAPQGSKRHVGRGILVESSAKVKPWREAVKHAALAELARGYQDFLYRRGEAVRVAVTFEMPRPASHYRTGANAALLRPQAPPTPTGRPDVDKLLRSTLDALGEAGVWHDDSQVVEVVAHKTYAAGPACAQITVRAA